MKNGLTDAEIMSNVLDALNSNANRFSKKLEYNAASTIYHVLNGLNKISFELVERTVKHYPNVNSLYMVKGEEPILINESKSIGQHNAMQHNTSYSFDNIPGDIAEIKSLLTQILAELKKD